MLTLRDASIMVVDDSPAMRRLLTGLVRTFGAANVIEASEGDQALDLFHRQPCDLLITDYAMQPTDGVSLTRRLRAEAGNPHADVPIIMVTSHGEEAYRQAAQEAGVDEYMLKPVMPGQLYAHILAALTHRRPMISASTYHGPDRRRELSTVYTGQERRRSH